MSQAVKAARCGGFFQKITSWLRPYEIGASGSLLLRLRASSKPNAENLYAALQEAGFEAAREKAFDELEVCIKLRV